MCTLGVFVLETLWEKKKTTLRLFILQLFYLPVTSSHLLRDLQCFVFPAQMYEPLFHAPCFSWMHVWFIVLALRNVCCVLHACSDDVQEQKRWTKCVGSWVKREREREKRERFRFELVEK